MFQTLARQWQEARGEALRKEAEDSILRLSNAGQEVNAICATVFASVFRDLDQRYGSLDNISNKAKKSLSKEILRKAKKKFDFDLGAAHGLFLLSAFLESQTLPGKDADFVRRMIEEFLLSAVEATEDLEYEVLGEQEELESDNAESIARSAMEMGKILGASNAREAAEMLAGRPFTDDEWAKCRIAWERNWKT